MKDTAFLVFCQLLVLGVMSSYGVFKAHFARDPSVKYQVQLLKKEIRSEKIRTDLATEGLNDFKVYVAQYLPEALKARGKTEAGYPLRNLASLTAAPAKTETIRESLVEGQFKKAKALYKAEDYIAAKRTLTDFIQKHPYSTNMIEANFLLMDCLSRLGEHEAVTQVIEKMVQQFPDSELTGFALIKLGNQLENQGRKLEASQVYRTVLKSYPFQDVTSAAAISLRSLEL